MHLEYRKPNQTEKIILCIVTDPIIFLNHYAPGVTQLELLYLLYGVG